MTETTQAKLKAGKLRKAIILLLGLLLFLFSIDLLTLSMIRLNNDLVEELLKATDNPFIGLFVGLLMTALVQSSSTVTAMVVAVVASGSLSLSQAVPVVMGANIGTTITSTLVAFSFFLKKGEFKRAMSAGVVHDIFNILTVLILFPLEFYFDFLSKLATRLTIYFFDANNVLDTSYTYNVLFTRPLTNWLYEMLNMPILSLVLAVVLLLLSIKFLSSAVLDTFITEDVKNVNKHIFKDPFVAFLYGLLATAAIQSSTVTTSLVVPAVANRKVSLMKVFPFIIGANIGTTITAAIAAIYKTEAAISLAIVHILFNLMGALIFLPSKSLRNIPVRLASFLGSKSADSKVVALAYILLTFFIIPFLLIYFNRQ